MADYQTFKKIDGNDAFLDQSVGPGKVTGVATGIVLETFTSTAVTMFLVMVDAATSGQFLQV